MKLRNEKLTTSSEIEASIKIFKEAIAAITAATMAHTDMLLTQNYLATHLEDSDSIALQEIEGRIKLLKVRDPEKELITVTKLLYLAFEIQSFCGSVADSRLAEFRMQIQEFQRKSAESILDYVEMQTGLLVDMSVFLSSSPIKDKAMGEFIPTKFGTDLLIHWANLVVSLEEIFLFHQSVCSIIAEVKPLMRLIIDRFLPSKFEFDDTYVANLLNTVSLGDKVLTNGTSPTFSLLKGTVIGVYQQYDEDSKKNTLKFDVEYENGLQSKNLLQSAYLTTGNSRATKKLLPPSNTKCIIM